MYFIITLNLGVCCNQVRVLGTNQYGIPLDGYYTWDGVSLINGKPQFTGIGSASLNAIWFDTDQSLWMVSSASHIGNQVGWILSDISDSNTCPSDAKGWKKVDPNTQTFVEDPNISVLCHTGSDSKIINFIFEIIFLQ